MTQPTIHVAILDEEGGAPIERVLMRRSVAELVIIYPMDKQELAAGILERYTALGFPVTSVSVDPYNFYSILTAVLRSLDHHRIDEYQIEFNVALSKGLLAIAACVAAAITNATILCPTADDVFEITEIWPSELMNLHRRKRDILDFLAKQPVPTYQKDITKETGIQRSGVSRHLSDLEKAGYIARIRHSRRKYVKITDLGSAILHYKHLRKRRFWGHVAELAAQPLRTVEQAHG
ncbi:MAG: ArsR family transcriptional regulator [Candidatus Thorarchaeota archaeon]|nr:ArsR family transcriptional regulator [Candidatus Thorarchaeota archaeon]